MLRRSSARFREAAASAPGVRVETTVAAVGGSIDPEATFPDGAMTEVLTVEVGLVDFKPGGVWIGGGFHDG